MVIVDLTQQDFEERMLDSAAQYRAMMGVTKLPLETPGAKAAARSVLENRNLPVTPMTSHTIRFLGCAKHRDDGELFQKAAISEAHADLRNPQ